MEHSRRLGLIVPSSNIVAEQDFSRFLPADVTLHAARVHLAETTAAAERVMLDAHAPQAAEDLGTLKPDAVVFSCTSAGALLGVDGEQQLERRLGELAKSPLVSTNAAVGTWLERVGARRLAVVTAYIDELNQEIAATLRHRGFEVAGITGFGITDNFSIALVSPEEIIDAVGSAVAELDGIDAVFISCTNLRATEAVDSIASMLDLPVVTSNLAAIEAALERLGLPRLELGLP